MLNWSFANATDKRLKTGLNQERTSIKLQNEVQKGRLMLRVAFALLFLVMHVACAAAQDKRIALVIGNSAYANVNSLKNPVNDADMSAALSRIGFNVTTLTNGSSNDMRKTLAAFAEKTKAALISFVYYSGHAVESGGVTWLVPTDGKADSLLSITKDAISLDQLLEAMAGVRDAAIILVDAARNDPYPTEKPPLRTGNSVPAVIPSNVLIGFATRAGGDVADGADRNSPYTAALLKHIGAERVSLQKIMVRVRDDVMAATNRSQQPFVYGSFSEDIFLSR
jgi:uncharacterized caspase-like protein